ncbi:MAG: hypothetical protein A2Y12_17295 [Planctomycetes bacterium GWF2_42_9]|nr:MAG: hypothetical protein A2Y12_17295 [Planctomycetes bacterium GWF2_42_9]
MNSKIFTISILIIAASTMAVQASDPTVLFSDQILEYTPNADYTTQNSQVVLSQNSGCLPWISDGAGWNAAYPASALTLPNQGVYIASSWTNNYTTIAVNKSTSARYGQVMARIAYQTDNSVPKYSFVRFGLFGAPNGTFATEVVNKNAYLTDPVNGGPAVRFWPDQLQETQVGGLAYDLAPTVAGYQDVTINYDLVSHTFDVWYGTVKVGDGASFDNNITSFESMAIGGAYWTGGIAVLDSWQWQTSDTTPFTTYGVAIPTTIPYTEPSPNTNLFVDHIEGYEITTTGANDYPAQNSKVVYSQHNGSFFAVTDNSGPFTATEPKRLVSFASGDAEQYTTVAVPKSSTVRYGQVMVRIGKTYNMYGNDWVRLALCGVTNPMFSPPFAEDLYPDAAADIIWHIGGKFEYGTKNSDGTNNHMVITDVDWPQSELHEVTINYDLQNKTYDAWLNQTKFVSGANFEYDLTSIEAIALGSQYASGGQTNTQVLDYWHWKVSDAGPFTCYGQEVTAACGDYGTVYKAGDLNSDCYVDFADVAEMAFEWLTCTDPANTRCDQYWK